MIPRHIESVLEAYLQSKDNRIFFLWGPRRSGKTTLLTYLSKKLKVPRFNFDLISDQRKFLPDKTVLQKMVSECPIILIDEIQNYPESTEALKILFDEFKVKVIATGSSELRQKSKHFDTLSGRFVERYCLPLSVEEIHAHASPKAYQEEEFLDELQKEVQLFGAYPEIYLASSEGEKIDRLRNIIETYVLKDILNLYDLRNYKLAYDILTKIALQIGQEVSLRELANSLGANVVTVSNYIEIFVRNYILIALPSFKTNLRRAVSQYRKYYFLDLGLRNGLVKDFRSLELRPDHGSVFENFTVSEWFKHIRNHALHYSMYFYREYGGKAVDLVMEDYKKKYMCLEVKANPGAKVQRVFPLKHTLKQINRKNYFENLHLPL